MQALRQIPVVERRERFDPRPEQLINEPAVEIETLRIRLACTAGENARPRYAGYVAKGLGDRVKNFFTLNEFQNFVDRATAGSILVVQGKPLRIELAPRLGAGTGCVEPGSTPRRACPRARREGDPREWQGGNQCRTGGSVVRGRAGDRRTGARQGGGDGHHANTTPDSWTSC